MANITGPTFNRKLYALEGLALLGEMGGEGVAPKVIEKASDMLGGIDARRYVQENVNHTAYFVARFGNNAIIACHGTDLESQYVPEFNGYVQLRFASSGPDDAYPHSTWARPAGEEVFATCQEIGIFNVQNIFVFGHSAGYGIAGECLRKFMVEFPLQRRSFVFTSFGGNGWANRTVRDWINSQTREYRWMVSADPVPLFPWCIANMLSGVYYLNPSALDRITNYVHTVPGLNIDRDGAVTERELPSDAAADPNMSVVAWLRAMRTGVNNEHSKAEYERRIRLLPDQSDPPHVPGRTHSQPETQTFPPLNLPAVPNAAEARRVLPSIVAAAQARADAEPAPIPTFLPDETYRARKVNGRWCVCKGDIIVVPVAGKREAKNTSRRLNRIDEDTRAIDNGKLLQQLAVLNS